jgi:hypothetical protein
LLNLTEMSEITKIPLIIFLIFLFSLTTIFNGMEYLKQNESLIHQSEFLNIERVSTKITKVQED